MQRTVSTRDGEGIKRALKAGYKIIIITGGNSVGMKKRFSYLRVLDFYDDVPDKMKVLQEIMEQSKIEFSNILYMGDDLPDIPVLRKVGISACPSDAAPDVLPICQFISNYKGGHGCVRDVIETVMRIQGKWPVL